jgi:hypothetical protein
MPDLAAKTPNDASVKIPGTKLEQHGRPFNSPLSRICAM